MQGGASACIARGKDCGRENGKRHTAKATYIGGHGLVHRTPPDVLVGGFLFDNPLVRGRTTSLSARVGGEGTAGGDSATGFVDQGIFVEGRDGGVGNLVLVSKCHHDWR